MHSLPLFIGLRYLASKRSNGFLSFVSIFAVGGMALGVFALIVVLSVMNGFDHELKQRILRAVPHAFVSHPQGITDWEQLAARLSNEPGLLAASPYVAGNGLISGRSTVKGVEIQGVDPVYESKVSPVADFFVHGQLNDLREGEFGLVLGRLLAYSLGVDLGDRVTITLPKVSITLAGIFPRSRQFTVVGVFEVGAQIDQSLAMIHLGDAQRLFRAGDSVEGLRLRYDDLYRAPAANFELRQTLGDPFNVVDWSQTQGSLFRAVKLEKSVTGLLLGIVIAVAAFNIITSLIMMVTEKKSDIAVLRTIGMTGRQVMMIFIYQGAMTALLGIGIGLISGVPAALYLPAIISWLESAIGWQIFDPSVYYVTQLPSLWMLSDTMVVSTFAAFISVLATLYPAFRASRILPAEAMRYDS